MCRVSSVVIATLLLCPLAADLDALVAYLQSLAK